MQTSRRKSGGIPERAFFSEEFIAATETSSSVALPAADHPSTSRSTNAAPSRAAGAAPGR